MNLWNSSFPALPTPRNKPLCHLSGVEMSGIEPLASRVQAARSPVELHPARRLLAGHDGGTRTRDKQFCKLPPLPLGYVVRCWVVRNVPAQSARS